jgi:hypothetical protein
MLGFGLLLAAILGASRMQSYVNGFIPKTPDETSFHLVHLDRTYLRKFTIGLSKFWLNGKVKLNPIGDGLV